MYSRRCLCLPDRSTLLQASNSGKQHYLRAVFSKAGSYALGVTVTDPVTSEAVPIPAHSASQQLVILPGALAAERTQISDPPATLTAGDGLLWPQALRPDTILCIIIWQAQLHGDGTTCFFIEMLPPASRHVGLAVPRYPHCRCALSLRGRLDGRMKCFGMLQSIT